MSACSACGDDRCNASLDYDQADSLDYFDAATEAAPVDPDFHPTAGLISLDEFAAELGIDLDCPCEAGCNNCRIVAPIDRVPDGGI